MTRDDCFWRGQKISDLSRDQLEDAFLHVTIEYHRMLSPTNIEALALGQVELAKRGRPLNRNHHGEAGR